MFEYLLSAYYSVIILFKSARIEIFLETITYISLSLGDLNTVLLHANEELTSVDLSVAVVRVELSESSAKTSDGGGSSSVQLLSESVQDYARKFSR